MLSFSKSYFIKASDKSSRLISPEMSFGSGIRENDREYVEKDYTSGLSFSQMELMYIANSWVRAIIDKIVERVCHIQPVIKPVKLFTKDGKETSDETKKQIEEVEKLLQMPNDNNETFEQLRKKTHRDLLVYDACGIEIVKSVDNDKKIFELFAVSGDGIKVNVDKRGILPDKKAYVQVDEGMRIVSKWNKDELLYFMLNPRANRTYGFSPLESLYQTVTAELSTSQYNMDFFNNQATPRFAVLMEGLGIGQGQPAMDRFRNWWNKELKGKPHKPIILGTEQGKIEFKQIGLTNEEMQFQQYSLWLLMKIMAVYKMQPMIMGLVSQTNIKTSDSIEQFNQFKIEAIRPQLTTFANKFNQQVIWSPSVFGYSDIFMDFDLDLVDKKAQAEWQERYLKNGVISINEIRAYIGMAPVSWGDVPYLQNNVAPFGQGSDGSSAVPNTQTNSKEEIKRYISKNGKLPIGWEEMELNEKMNVLTGIIEMKEKELSKIYSFGEE